MVKIRLRGEKFEDDYGNDLLFSLKNISLKNLDLMMIIFISL